MRLRAPTLGDLPQLVELFSALQEQGIGGASEGELRDWLANPMFDPALDFRVALVDGRPVGWCDVWDRDRSGRCFWLDVRAHPRAEETYDALLEFGLGRAGELARGAAVARVIVESEDDVLAASVRRSGFAPVRYAFRMELDLADEPPAPRWPEGVAVRTYVSEDARAVYDAEAEVFAGDWNYARPDFEDWRHEHVLSSEFDPGLWFLAEEEGELAGFSLCRSERRPGTGHVGELGVRMPWRRRGLGTALLLHSFRELRRRGRARADLGVDADNPTGALSLYEGVGMRVAHRWDTYERSLGL